MNMTYDKKLRRFTFTNDKCEVWRNFPAHKIRLLLKTYGMSRQQITTMMTQAKCRAYGI